MQGLRIWAIALRLYGGFALWYDNWRGPPCPDEIDRLLERARVQSSIEPERLAQVRASLAADEAASSSCGTCCASHPSRSRRRARACSRPRRS